jgi:hypothetical protein
MGPLQIDDFGIDDPSIASYSPDYGSSTVVEGLNSGEAFISGSWPTDTWTSDGWSICYESRDEATDSQRMQMFTVVLALRSSGSVSSDNAGLSAYSTDLGTSDLGVFLNSGANSEHIWRVAGVEISGALIPASHIGLVVIHRTIIESRSYIGNNSTPFQTITNQPDTTAASQRDDDPQSGGSGGYVYDLDAPGVGTTSSAPVGTIVRRRVNFVQYMTVDGKVLSHPILSWYARQSIIKTSSGDQLLNDISGDNSVGLGTTALTWNLQ